MGAQVIRSRVGLNRAHFNPVGLVAGMIGTCWLDGLILCSDIAIGGTFVTVFEQLRRTKSSAGISLQTLIAIVSQGVFTLPAMDSICITDLPSFRWEFLRRSTSSTLSLG